MAEFIRTEEKVVNVGEPVIFENNTDSDFSVSAAIVFRKSGLYDVSIVGKRTIISEVTKRKIGRWIPTDNESFLQCSECGRYVYAYKHPTKVYPYCNCGAKMEDEG